LGGAVGTGLLGSTVGASSDTPVMPECIGRPEQTEGPYYLDSMLNRSDIRSEPADGSVVDGVPLLLEFRVSQVTPQGCTPLSGAVVDVWHCDARGVYSGGRDPNYNTVGKKFLRGYQTADNAGKARFQTIYPGWYPGRTVHMHFKIRTNASGRAGSVFTSQLYFDDSITDQVHRGNPYADRGPRMVRNGNDFLFRAGGDRLTLALEKAGEGFKSIFEIGLQ
jgi:protocatechuate 3,4-dioxygenase beta subunit